MTRTSWEEAVLSRPKVREGEEKNVRPKREAEAADQARHDELSAKLAEVEASLNHAQEQGDPDGQVPELVAQRRSLREELEEVSEVLVARVNATAGAMKAQHKLVLDEIAAHWSEQDAEAAKERLRERTAAVLESFDELFALSQLHNSLRHWANHIAVRRLDGEVQVPPMDPPRVGTTEKELGITANRLRQLAEALHERSKAA